MLMVDFTKNRKLWQKRTMNTVTRVRGNSSSGRSCDVGTAELLKIYELLNKHTKTTAEALGPLRFSRREPVGKLLKSICHFDDQLLNFGETDDLKDAALVQNSMPTLPIIRLILEPKQSMTHNSTMLLS